MSKNFRALMQGFALALGLGTAGAAEAQTTVTLNPTGASQSFVVPANVTSINIVANGAQGFDANGNLGGRSGRAIGTLAVTPGETLLIYVGGRGTAAVGKGVIAGGGFNGGCDGKNNSTVECVSGGGGGASDVRQGGGSLANRIIVAAGGGGATANSTAGGNGVGLIGGKGTDNYGELAGTGGTQSAGGSLGGALGLGGSANAAGTGWIGGGGGGYYGGGASTDHLGGGGGSSFISGAGLTAGATTAGVRVGDGLVTLTYTASAPPATVPTLSEWAMILLAVALAGGSAIYIQRRRIA